MEEDDFKVDDILNLINSIKTDDIRKANTKADVSTANHNARPDEVSASTPAEVPRISRPITDLHASDAGTSNQLTKANMIHPN